MQETVIQSSIPQNEFDLWQVHGNKNVHFSDECEIKIKILLNRLQPLRTDLPYLIGDTGYLYKKSDTEPVSDIRGWCKDVFGRHFFFIDDKIIMQRYIAGNMMMIGDLDGSHFKELKNDEFDKIINKL
jgi:hypothetical protein